MKDGCYLSTAGGCSDKISREHFQSEGIIREIEDEGSGPMFVSGPPWTEDGEVKALSAGSLVVKVLCTAHNERLSPLDDIGKRFFIALRDMARPWHTEPRSFLFNGHDIERWMFKYLCGYLLGGVGTAGLGFRMPFKPLREALLPLVWDWRAWGSRPIGLALLRFKGKRKHQLMVRSGLLLEKDRKGIDGIRLDICGFEFMLLTSPRPPDEQIAGMNVAMRPARMRLTSDFGVSDLHLCWNDGGAHPQVEYVFAGVSKAQAGPRR